MSHDERRVVFAQEKETLTGKYIGNQVALSDEMKDVKVDAGKNEHVYSPVE
jgi:hypothetical protein